MERRLTAFGTLLALHNLSRLLDRLEGARLVHGDAFLQDGRGRWVVLTDEGAVMQARMWAIYGAAIQRHVGAKLTEKEAHRLADLLAKLCQGAD